MLAVTSGTTGKSSLIPKTTDNSRAFVEFGFAIGVYHSIFNAIPKVRTQLNLIQNQGLKNMLFWEEAHFKYANVKKKEICVSTLQIVGIFVNVVGFAELIDWLILVPTWRSFSPGTIKSFSLSPKINISLIGFSSIYFCFQCSKRRTIVQI